MKKSDNPTILIDKKDLLAAVTLAAGACAGKSATMPILACVHLSAFAAQLAVTGSDMIVSVAALATCEASGQFEAVVNAKALRDVVGTLPDRRVTLTWDKARSTLGLTVGRSSFTLLGLTRTDYPAAAWPAMDSYTEIEIAGLRELIASTLFSVSEDDARVNLCGALLEVDGDEAVMVSTDGHRLTKNAAALALPTMAKPVIIPRAGLREIMQVLKTVIGATVGIAFDGQHVYLQAPNVTLGIKLNGVAFPPYREVIPTSHTMAVRVNRKALIEVLERAEVVSPSKTSTVRMTIADGEIELVSDNPDLGTARQLIDVEVIGSTTSLSIGFNATYLIDAVKAIDVDVVEMRFRGELDPCKVVAVGDESTGYTAVVMPLRI